MAKATPFLVICALFLYSLLSFPATASTHHHHHHHHPLTTTALFVQPSTASSEILCSEGSIEDCLGGGEEFEMESETTRRMLAIRRRYISYGALSRNSVPCSRRGVSYYNCRPGAPANPYNRGCSAITRCRR